MSPLALGTMTFGTQRWGSPDEVSESIFHTYVDAGGNFIDTADVYANGRSEELIGGYIADRHLRDRLVLATKFVFTVANQATQILAATVARTSIEPRGIAAPSQYRLCRPVLDARLGHGYAH